ncbi:MAG: hypothetical protein IKP65_03355 [Alphaproteobacteria bacterium]|nr:hypothetical protein [Alphaproteobacteria bacterium]
MFCVEEKNENLNYLVVEESLNANPDFNIVMNFKPEEDSLKIMIENQLDYDVEKNQIINRSKYNFIKNDAEISIFYL